MGVMSLLMVSDEEVLWMLMRLLPITVMLLLEATTLAMWGPWAEKEMLWDLLLLSGTMLLVSWSVNGALLELACSTPSPPVVLPLGLQNLSKKRTESTMQ